MISILKWGGIIFLYLFLSIFFKSCTRPEDNAIKPLEQKVQMPDSTQVIIPTYRPKIHTVEISGMKFNPDVITVHKGDTIIWKNNDLVVHCVTELPTNAWTSSKIPPGASWEMVVNTSSNYFCAIHLVMKGKIIVE
ncbi:MAG: cupredoxin domain-containing protein [Ginsengibacter sp.]